MRTQKTAGLKPCETTNGSNNNSSGCQLCPNPADGYDATFGGPLCTPCAATRNVDEDTVAGHNARPSHSLADRSPTQRDLLWILSQTGPSASCQLHNALTDYYTDSIDHARVRDNLEELTELNYVTTYLNDPQYRLTESARRALAARQAWQAGTHTAVEGSQ